MTTDLKPAPTLLGIDREVNDALRCLTSARRMAERLMSFSADRDTDFQLRVGDLHAACVWASDDLTEQIALLRHEIDAERAALHAAQPAHEPSTVTAQDEADGGD